MTEIEQMTKEEAIAFCDSEKWKEMTSEQIVQLQLYQKLLCVPFDVFHGAVEAVLKRPVWTHEFANIKSMQEEFEGKRPKATMDDIMDKIPEHLKVCTVVHDKS
jgi:hypothetical protein